MKIIFQIFFTLLIFSQSSYANMASPITEGSKSAIAFSSRDVDILSEFIHIKIDKDFRTAFYEVEYTIQCDKAGMQIPLLFLARDYKDSFRVWLDDQPLALQNISDQNSPDFSMQAYIGQQEVEKSPRQISISWDEHNSRSYPIDDLKYFHTELQKGVHKVRVTYSGNVWTDRSDWLRSSSFRYSLSPAKYWRSFGGLTLVVELAGTAEHISSNLGLPVEGKISAKNTWTFSKLPSEYILISLVPEPGKLAKQMMRLQPFGIAVIVSMLLVLIHLWLVVLYRKKNPAKPYSSVAIVGMLLMPLLFILSYLYAFDFIDYLIGEAASKRHGYVFLIVITYPVMLIAYGILVWLIDKFAKNKFAS